jgi:hypothetical protein
MKWMDFGCETPLVAKRHKRVNTFFSFPRFLPVLFKEAHLLAESAKRCQYFFWETFLER